MIAARLVPIDGLRRAAWTMNHIVGYKWRPYFRLVTIRAALFAFFRRSISAGLIFHLLLSFSLS